MKIFSYIVAFIFVTFLCTSTLDCLIDGDVDIPILYNANEEESSSKNQISFEYTLEEMDTNYGAIHFLPSKKEAGFFYLVDQYDVILSVNYPPPKLA